MGKIPFSQYLKALSKTKCVAFLGEIRNVTSPNEVSTIGDKRVWLWEGNLTKALEVTLPQWIQSAGRESDNLGRWIRFNFENRKTIVWIYHKSATAYRILFHMSIYRRGSIEYQGAMPNRSIQTHFRQGRRSKKRIWSILPSQYHA